MGPTTGRVTSFDAERGLGEVTASDGEVFPFHCVEIADGSRTIEVGTAVAFVPSRKLGRQEATALTATAPTPPTPPIAQLLGDVDTRTVGIA